MVCSTAAPALEQKSRPGEKKGILGCTPYYVILDHPSHVLPSGFVLLTSCHGGRKVSLTEACPPGFVEEMRFVAMRLHTKDQAPKEGQRESAEKAWKQARALFPWM